MKLNYDKYADGLVPAIVQDAKSGTVLMLGFVNEEAMRLTEKRRRVTFFSRSRQELWTKGETSGNFLKLVSIHIDCDEDTLLIKAEPVGPTCHTGEFSCFGSENVSNLALLDELEAVIDERRSNPNERSYVSDLFAKGINKIAQKVGEEAVELVIEAKDDNIDAFRSEAADLLFHYLVLLRAKDVSVNDILTVLESRRKSIT